MPELPEVETVRRDLETDLVGARFTDIKIIAFKNVAPSAAFLARYLKGADIIALRRRGKLLIFDLEKAGKRDHHLLVHLKMTGQLVYVGGHNLKMGGHSLSDGSFETSVGGKLPNKYTRAYFSFHNGGTLYFNDLRKFGYLKLVGSSELAEILAANYGPEPLSKDFTAVWLVAVLSKRKAPVKAALLDQKLIAGLGNIYADEALFRSRIDPSRAADTLKPVSVKALHQAIVDVLKLAVKARGTTFRNYVDAKGKKGKFIDFLQVYKRDKQACPNCGRPILKKRVAGRGTHYCAYCQK